MRAPGFFVNSRLSPTAWWLAGGVALAAAVLVTVLAVRSHRHVAPPPPASAPAARSTPALPDFEVKPVATEEGKATWYDVPERSLAQRRAWPGELTAASDRFPKESYVRVRRIDAKGDQEKTVVVRITDNGVHQRGTLVDLCREAAEALGMVEAGEVRVRVETLALQNATTNKPVEKKSDPPLMPKASEITDQPTANEQQEKDAAKAKTGAQGEP